MPMELKNTQDLQHDLVKMAEKLDARVVNAALKAGAAPIYEDMLRQTTIDQQIRTRKLRAALEIGAVRARRQRKSIPIGILAKNLTEENAWYARLVEYGHGGPAPAPAHPFVRPAFDRNLEKAYEEMKRVLRDGLK